MIHNRLSLYLQMPKVSVILVNQYVTKRLYYNYAKTTFLRNNYVFIALCVCKRVIQFCTIIAFSNHNPVGIQNALWHLEGHIIAT